MTRRHLDKWRTRDDHKIRPLVAYRRITSGGPNREMSYCL